MPSTTNSQPKARTSTFGGDGNISGWLPTFAKYGGFGGLVLFVFTVLFSKFGDLKPLFGNLNAAQTYNIIMTFMLLVFIFSVFSLVVWVVVNNQKRESRAVRIGLLILMALLVSGVAAWATVNGTRQHIAESLGQGLVIAERSSGSESKPPVPAPVEAPDLEAHKWLLSIRTSELPPFESNPAFIGGKTSFMADHTFEAAGQFLIPTGALNEHLACPGGLKGSWSYNSGNTGLNIENLKISQMSDYQISKDEYRQCSSTLTPLLPQGITRECKFQSKSTCVTDGLEIHFTQSD